MELMAGREYFFCAFCGSFQFLQTVEASADRVKPLGERADAGCPICKAHLTQAAMDGRRVSFCDRCRGVLVSNDDFLAIIRKRRAERNGPPDQPSPLNRDALKRHVDCPQCQRRMETHPYYGPGNAVIDSCGQCRLIWLDHGEIGVIERAPGSNW